MNFLPTFKLFIEHNSINFEYLEPKQIDFE